MTLQAEEVFLTHITLFCLVDVKSVIVFLNVHEELELSKSNPIQEASDLHCVLHSDKVEFGIEEPIALPVI